MSVIKVKLGRLGHSCVARRYVILSFAPVEVFAVNESSSQLCNARSHASYPDYVEEAASISAITRPTPLTVSYLVSTYNLIR